MPGGYERKGGGSAAAAAAAPVQSVNGRTGTVTGLSEALSPTAVKTANYTAAANEFVPVDTTSGNITITLPTAPADKTRVAIKHVVRGSTNTVTLATGGADVFNVASGATTATITLANQAIQLQYKATGAIWYAVADDIPLSQLDLRYLGISTAIPESQVTGLVADLGAKVGASITMNNQSGTTYTAQTSDLGAMIRFTGSSAAVLTLPNSMAIGFSIMVAQSGTGQVTFTAASGATLVNSSSLTKTRAQYSVCSLVVTQNDDNASAKWLLAGDAA